MRRLEGEGPDQVGILVFVLRAPWMHWKVLSRRMMGSTWPSAEQGGESSLLSPASPCLDTEPVGLLSLICVQFHTYPGPLPKTPERQLLFVEALTDKPSAPLSRDGNTTLLDWEGHGFIHSHTPGGSSMEQGGWRALGRSVGLTTQSFQVLLP